MRPDFERINPPFKFISDAQMAESVDALVSNTCGRKAVPVRPRLWVQRLGPLIADWGVVCLKLTRTYRLLRLQIKFILHKFDRV